MIDVLPIALTHCDKCSLCGGQKPEHPIAGSGPETASLVVVGEAPAPWDLRAERGFTGDGGRLLWRELALRDVAREDVYATHVLMCPTPKGKAIKPKDLEACRERLDAELDRLDPKVILVLGATAATVLRGQKSSISQLSGHSEWSERYNAHLAFCYNPNAVLGKPELYQDFAWAVRRAVEMLDAEPGPREYLPIRYEVANINDISSALSTLEHAYRFPLLVCDIETTGLSPMTDRVLTVGLAWSPDFAYIVPDDVVRHPMVLESMKRLLERPRSGVPRKVIGHNYKFDVEFLRLQYGIEAYVGGDTMLLHYVTDERTGGEGGGFHDLKRLSRKYCDAPSYAEHIDGEYMERVPFDELCEYQANDLVYTFRLYHELMKVVLSEPESNHGYKEPIELYERLLIPAANAFVRAELRGVRIDIRKLMEMKTRYQEMIEETAEKALAYLSDRGIVTSTNFNLNSPLQVARLLFDPEPFGFGYPHQGGTSEAAIHECQRIDARADRPINPFLDMVIEYRSLKHTLTTYINGILQRLIYANPDGRLRSSFLIHGTTTGRLASRNPNLQNIPADSEVKSLFIPAPGFTLLNADYRRLEVGVLAYMSRDPALIVDFQAEDFHWSVAQKIFPRLIPVMEHAREAGDLAHLAELCRVTSSLQDFYRRQQRPSEATTDPEVLYGWMKTRLRRQAKYVSFGIMYGEGAFALSDEEKGLGVPVSDAQGYIDNWKTAYATAIEFLDDTAYTAKRQGWIEGATGRRRRFVYPISLAKRLRNEAMNHPIQSFASDINLLSFIRLDEILPAKGYGHPLLPVHDSILFELRTETLTDAKFVIHDTMTTVVRDPEIVFEIDMAEGPNWAECH